MVEPDRATPTLDALDRTHPGLTAYLHRVADYLGMARTLLCQRCDAGLARLGHDAAAAACGDWQRLGILPGLDIRSDAQVAAIWRSPLFAVLLDDGLRFAPPPGTDLRRHRPAPARDVDAYLRRQRPALEQSYWQLALSLDAPELYLEPFLPGAGRPLLGCDLACGWGRASFSLGDRDDLRLWACDLTARQLVQLRELARCSGRADHITPLCGDVTALPFADASLDFVLALDIFEHLGDAALRRCRDEILRCARPGAVLYAEIPLHNCCPAVTHIQDFSQRGVQTLFEAGRVAGRALRLRHHDARIPDHFTFVVERS